MLDQTVDWYRTLGTQQQAATEPSDMLIFYDNRLTASKVMTLAFDIARVDAEMLGKEPLANDDTGGDGTVSSQALRQLQRKLDAQALSVQAELDGARQRLAKASRKARVETQAKINELQGELDLVNTKKGILGTMMSFAVGTGGSSAGALKAQIDAMAVSIPSAAAPSTTPTPATTGAASSAPAAAPSPLAPAAVAETVGRFGLWDLAANAVRLSEKSGTIDSIDLRTAALQATLLDVTNARHQPDQGAVGSRRCARRTSGLRR